MSTTTVDGVDYCDVCNHCVARDEECDNIHCAELGELKQLRAKLARVEALLKSWRSSLDHCNADTLDRLEPARELEAALKGTP